MRTQATLATLCLAATLAMAQDRPFEGRISNAEHKVYIRMNLYDRDVVAPDNEPLGELDGYIGSTQSTNKWLIVSSEVQDERSALIRVVNDYGSDDFTAELTVRDGTYTLRKVSGSTMRFAVRDKWQKVPGTLTLTR